MACQPFENSNLKLARARYHIAEFEKEIIDFLNREPFCAVIEYDHSPSKLCLTYRVRESVPKVFSAMIGDVIHNLRASLDLLACELVRLNGEDDKNVYFPFCDNEAGLDDMIKNRNIDRAAPHAVDLLRSLKPYKGGNDALRAIHDLDIMDKHKALIPMGDCASFDGLPPEISIHIDNRQSFGPVEDGFSPFYFPAAPTLGLGQKIPATFILTFAPLGPLGLGEIIPTLHNLAELVAGIIESFEALGLGETSPPNGTP